MPDALSASHPEAQWAAAWRAFEGTDAAEEHKQPVAAGGRRQRTQRSGQVPLQQKQDAISVTTNPADGASDVPAAQLALQVSRHSDICSVCKLVS